MASSKPLFSRRQLNAIMAITAVAIALLSIPSSPWPQIQRQQLQQVPLSYIVDEALPIELRLTFALPQPTLLPHEPARLLTRLLTTRLQHAAPAHSILATLHNDRLTISLNADDIESLNQQLSRIPQLLRTAFDSAMINNVINHRRAERHLDKHRYQPLQSIDHWLQQHNDSSTQPPGTTEHSIIRLQQQLFSRTRLRLSLTGPNPEPVSAALTTLLSQLEPVLLAPDTIASATPAQLLPAQAEPNRSAGLPPGIALQPLPGRRSADFPRSLLLSRILTGLTDRATIKLHPAAERSWLIWLQPQTAASPSPSSQWLAERFHSIRQRLAGMQDWELERTADDLRQQLQQRLQQPQALAGQLEVIAFYRLPVDYPARFEATIAALSGAELRQQLLNQLQPERVIRSSSNTDLDATPVGPSPTTTTRSDP